ncbi:MAG: hypothetical protein MJY99_09660 [Fibrobacter sp.]|nr:hypothetical protein [Fibrobacter sp.]
MQTNYSKYKIGIIAVLALCCAGLFCSCIDYDRWCGVWISATKPTGADSVTMRIYYKDSLIYKGTTDLEEHDYHASWSDSRDLVIRKGTVSVDIEVFCEKGSVRLPKTEIDFDRLFFSSYEFKDLTTEPDTLYPSSRYPLFAEDTTCGTFEHYGLEQTIIEDCHEDY